jgi:hypothetical protein
MLLLVPENRDRIGIMLKSELMKNIYAYRLLKSGILDSLADGRYLREDKYLFPLIDSLLPTFDDDLLMHAEWVVDDYNMSIWRFYYPGVDMIRKTDSDPRQYSSYRKDSIWERYYQLEPTTYVVGYDPRRQVVHFLAGTNIFLTRIGANVFPCQDRMCDDEEELGSSTFDFFRRRFVQLKMLGLSKKSDRYYEIEPIGEDSTYWYYRMEGLTPIVTIRDNAPIPDAPPIRLWNVQSFEQCTYTIRMNKENFELVEIIEKTDCKESNYIEQWWIKWSIN